MGRFAYNAVDNSGKEHFGIVEADTESDAINDIGRKGLVVVDLHVAHISDELRWKWREQKEHRYIEELKQKERTRARHPRQRLVVRFTDGRIKHGVCYALNPNETEFHLDLVDDEGRTTGETQRIRYADLKAVFHVKSFDGNFKKGERYTPPFDTGDELIVEFKDSEVIRGITSKNYSPDIPRFVLIPTDSKSNNISILVERSAVNSVMTPEEYHAKKKQEQEERRQKTTDADLSQEETLGDFYFETRNYPTALEQYEAALKTHAQSHRLQKKIRATKFNIGVQHIKRRDYEKALEIMEALHKVDPSNEHVNKKIHKLRKIVEKERNARNR